MNRDRAGWDCEQCRRQGLDVRRRCGFLPEDRRGPRKVVWARRRAGTEECPKSFVTPESVAHVEKFVVWKLSGGGALWGFTAREADALLTLDEEWRAELTHGE